MRKLWCMGCASRGQSTPATHTIEDDHYCFPCAKREADASGAPIVQVRDIPVAMESSQTPQAETKAAANEATQRKIKSALPKPSAPRSAPLFALPHRHRVSPEVRKAICDADPAIAHTELAVRYGISDSKVGVIRREAGIAIPHRLRVSQEVRKAVRDADPSITHTELATRYGISDTKVGVIRREAGIVIPPRRGRRLSPEMRDDIIALAPLCSCRAVAKSLGISQASVKTVCLNAGVKLRPTTSKEKPMTHEAKAVSKRVPEDVKKAIRDAGPEIRNADLCRKYKISDGYISQLRKDAREARAIIAESQPKSSSHAHGVKSDSQTLHLAFEMNSERADAIWDKFSLEEKIAAIQDALVSFLEGAQ